MHKVSYVLNGNYLKIEDVFLPRVGDPNLLNIKTLDLKCYRQFCLHPKGCHSLEQDFLNCDPESK